LKEHLGESMANTVVVRHINVPFSCADLSPAGMRIAHLSDLHFCRWSRVLETARELLRSLPYDALAVTGDFSDWRRNWRRTVRMMREFFGPIAGNRPIYATLGNHDHPRIAEAADMPIRFLRDDSTIHEHRNGLLRIAGVEQLHQHGGDTKKACLSRDVDLPTVLLAHYPSTVYRLGSARVGLVLSGHTHGGQIRLPHAGCVWSNDSLPPRLAHGLSRVNGTTLHVSAGIGVSWPLPVRVNCPPEISILTLDPLTAEDAAPTSENTPIRSTPQKTADI